MLRQHVELYTERMGPRGSGVGRINVAHTRTVYYSVTFISCPPLIDIKSNPSCSLVSVLIHNSHFKAVMYFVLSSLENYAAQRSNSWAHQIMNLFNRNRPVPLPLIHSFWLFPGIKHKV